jgi:hypothetical protein
MFSLLIASVARSRAVEHRDAHVHVDAAGRRFTCHLRDCQPARRPRRGLAD